ncbi:hypothetical protein RHSP_32539 [Rhizobium freirei PRF 81]|uniref:Uncharacterized protein n=1 Tax=Rhizobium freirei PRF 81 TaxID=363754 RepID=N6UWT4_9HYPH|nr:hypothetical protein RHSP_32539 [Rhizobium freirei PRF 81]
MIGRLFARHDRRGVQIAVGDVREDRAVGDTQAIHADDAGIGIDDRHRIVLRAHLAGAAGVIGALQMFAQEGIDLIVGLNICPRLDFSAAIVVESLLPEDLAGEAHAMAELLPVFRMAHIVEADHRIGLRIGGAQRHVAARFRQIVADMHLEAVAPGRRLAVIADGNRQEVILDIRLLDAGRRAQERTGFELVGGAEPLLEEQPLRARDPLHVPGQPGIERHRLHADLLEIEFHMVLQVRADARSVELHLDPHVAQVLTRSDAGEHQQLRGVERGGGDDHLAVRPDHLDLAVALDFDAGRAAVFDDDLAGEAADELHVRPFEGRLEIGCRRGPAPAHPGRLFHQAEAFLLAAVVILCRLEACLLAGLDEGVEQRVADVAPAHMQRAVGAAPSLFAAMRMLHPLEVGQHIGIGPALGAEFFPAIEVLGMAAHIDHAVDRGGAADHLAARRGDAAVIELRLRLGKIAPIVAVHAHRPGKGGRHLDERAEIAASELQNDDRMLAVLRQTGSHGGAGRARADDDEICLHDHVLQGRKSRRFYTLPLRGRVGRRPGRGDHCIRIAAGHPHPPLCGDLPPQGGGGSIRRLYRPHADIDGLQFRIMLQCRQRILAAEAGLLGAAEGNLHRGEIVGVDPERAGFELVDDAVGTGEVGSEDAAGKAEFGGIGAGDHLGLVIEIENTHDWPEDFFAGDRHIVGDIGKHGRLNVIAFARDIVRDAAAGQQRRALGLALFDIGEHLFALSPGDHRADLRCLVHRVADEHSVGAGLQALQEFGLDLAVDKDAGAVGADLAGRIEIAEHRAADGAVDIGIVEDDQRRLAAELHGDMLEVAGGRSRHLAARRHGAGQRHLRHIRMVDEQRPGLAVALDDIVKALGQAGFDKDFSNLQRAERRVFRRLEYHGVAGDEGRRALPAGDLLRIVPCADADADAERHALGIGEVAAERDVGAVEAGGRDAAEEFEAVGARRWVGDNGFLDRLARIQRFQLGKLAVTLAHDIGRALQDAAACRRAHGRPFRLCPAGASDRLLDDGRRRCVQAGDHFAGRRIDAFNKGAVGVLDIFPVDEMRGFRLCAHYRTLNSS